MIKPSHIFVVEDDPITSFLIQSELRKKLEPIRIQTFGNGEDALFALFHMLKNEKCMPDVVLLDLNMPVLDGWDFLDTLISFRESIDIPIVLITSSIDPADEEKSKDYAMVKAMLKKPFQYSDLAQILELEG